MWEEENYLCLEDSQTMLLFLWAYDIFIYKMFIITSISLSFLKIIEFHNVKGP